jgi:hypothetical protein
MLTLDTSMGYSPQIGSRVRRSERVRSLYLRPLPRVVNTITTGESDDIQLVCSELSVSLPNLGWSACDRESHRTAMSSTLTSNNSYSTQTFAGA